MSTSTPRKKNSKNDNIGGAKSSSSRGKRNKSDFIDFKGKKLGMEGAQNLKGLRKVNKLYNGEIQPKDFEPRYMTHAADDSFDEQLTSLNKKSNEMLADLKNVYLKLRVLTEVSKSVYMFIYLRMTSYTNYIQVSNVYLHICLLILLYLFSRRRRTQQPSSLKRGSVCK